MRRAGERHVNWQVVSIDATPAELRESPLLYIASDRALTLNPDQKFRLKDFILQGGMIVGVNEGKSDQFTHSFESLGKELFPGYSFRDLPREHPAYTANFAVGVPTGPIRGMSNDLRELLVVYPDSDMSWRWQSERRRVSAEEHALCEPGEPSALRHGLGQPALQGRRYVDRPQPGSHPDAHRAASRAFSIRGTGTPSPAGGSDCPMCCGIVIGSMCRSSRASRSSPAPRPARRQLNQPPPACRAPQPICPGAPGEHQVAGFFPAHSNAAAVLHQRWRAAAARGGRRLAGGKRVIRSGASRAVSEGHDHRAAPGRPDLPWRQLRRQGYPAVDVSPLQRYAGDARSAPATCDG